MYLSYYQLESKPFQITTDSNFLWLGEKHKEAFATLKYGIWDNKGFLLLTGEVGSGKTTLLNALVKSLDKRVIVARIADPGLTELDFYRLVARTFHFKNTPRNKGDFLYSCTAFLNQVHKARRKVVLIVDEAQRISNELLEDIRMLSNIEREDSKLINIFFVGQSEFNDILLDPRNRAIRQRITVNYNLETLKEHEVFEYIRHRLKIAGTDKEIFSREAVHEIFLFSGGVPRLINIICDRALLTGYISGKRRIPAGIIAECAKELQIKSSSSEESEAEQQPVTPEADSVKESKGRLETGQRSDRKKEISSSQAVNEGRSAARVHFFYIILICLLLAAIGYFSLDIGELMQNILISLQKVFID